MSDFDALTLQNRRLSLRNSRLYSAPQLSFSGSTPYSHHRKPVDLDNDEHEWESERETDDRARSPSPQHQHQQQKLPSLYPQHPHHRRGRSTDGNTKYIEFLERQVTELTGQLETSSSSSHAARNRKLAAENRGLRKEVEEWEARFEARVSEERSGDRQLRALATEMAEKLEDGEAERAALVEENRRLEFRVQALAELLNDATRDAKSQQRSTITAAFPQRVSSLPSSPESRRVSADISGSPSRLASADPTQTELIQSESAHTKLPPTEPTLAGLSPSRDRRISTSSETTPRDRRVSTSSITASEFGPPISPSSSISSSSPRRRMRRFPPGSSVPKPLILPSVAAAPTLKHRNSLFMELLQAGDNSEEEEEEEDNNDNNNHGTNHNSNSNSKNNDNVEIAPSTPPPPISQRRLSSVLTPARSFSSAFKRVLPRTRERKVSRAACKECGRPIGRVGVPGIGLGLGLGIGGVKKHDDAIEVLWLWVRLIIAVVVALGVAVKDGPGSVVEEGVGGWDGVRDEERERALEKLEGRSPNKA